MQFVTDALAANRRATRTASDKVILRGQGKTFRVLVDPGGGLTAAGRDYEEQTGAPLPREGFDSSQPTERQDNVETILVRGARRVVRTFDPSAMRGAGRWRYTQLGRQYFSDKRVNWIVRVPAKFRGTNARGNSYSRDGMWPVSAPIALPVHLSQTQRDQRIRQAVQATITDGLLAEFSQESVKLRRNVPWQIMEEVTQSGGAGDPVTEIRERPLGDAPLRYSAMPFSEHLTPRAFEAANDKLCCPRQLAEVTGLCFEEILGLLDSVAGAWRKRGATSKDLFKIAAALGRGACCMHGSRVVETATGPDPICWLVHESHAYLYADASVRRKLARRLPTSDVERLKQPPARRGAIGEVLDWHGIPVPGNFKAPEDSLEEIRGQFLARGRAPRVTMKDAWRVKRLEYVFGADEEHAGKSCVITAWPEEGERVAAWFRNLAQRGVTGLCYSGQGIAGATHEALLRVMKAQRERVWLEPEQKHEVLERAGYACAICGTKGGVLQMDHKIRVSQSYGAQNPDSFQAVCVACHSAKSKEEPQSYEADVLASYVNPFVWSGYVEAARPPPLVYHFEEVPEDLESLRIADVIRCRKRALEFAEHELPIFCVYDDIVERTEPELGDINWVTRPAGCFRELLGYTGPGPQHRVQTEWLMEQGVIGWSDISHTLTATGRLPRDVLREPFRILEEAWGADAQWGPKESINALTGLFCLDEAWRYSLCTSSFSADAPKAAFRRVFHHPGGHVTDHISKQRLRSIATHRPLIDICMGAEAKRIGQALALLRDAGAVVYEVKTDSILYSADCDLTSIQHYTGDPVFRQGPVAPRDLMKSRGKMPRREEAEGPRPLPQWTELSEEEARAHVLAGGSIAIEGCAGTGKSTWVACLAKALADSGKTMSRISKTHCASSRIGGVTADHFARSKILNGVCTSDIIWCDEVFQTECALMTQIAKLPISTQFILTGDPHQFGPCWDSWRGCRVPPGAFESSSVYWSMASGHRLTLTQCRRSDQELFAYYTSLIQGGARFTLPLAEVLEECRGLYRFEGPARHNVCISHRARRRINAQIGALFKPRGALYLRASSQNEESTWIWPGCPVIGASSAQRSKVQNNVTYEIQEVAEDHVILEGGRKLSHALLLSLTRPAWCRTIASIQGDEFDEELRIWDTRNPHFTMRSLYVCLSRSKSAARIHVT